jgi:nitrile hydratase
VSRINDVGGMQGFPPVQQEPDEEPFHADWEAHVFAVNRALIGGGVYNLDEFRDAIERMPPQQYLASSYYEKWFFAITTLLAEKGVLTAAELAGEAGAGSAGRAEAGPSASAEPGPDGD